MFTVCPKCALTLAVTVPDLRVGQGYVRCGRCSNVFNALLTLSEEPGRPGAAPGQTPLPPPPAEALPSAAGAPADRTPPPADSAPQLTEHDVTFVVDTEAPRADSGTETQEFRGTGTFETIVLEGEGITQTEEMVPEETVDTQIAEIAQRIAAQNHPGTSPVQSDAVAIRADVAEAAAAIAALTPPESAPVRQRVWGLAAVALLLLLLGLQAAHHWRNDLATSPAFNGPLTRIYAVFGLTLAPSWDLGSYEVNQLGAGSDARAAGVIDVRLSVMNHAERAQPPPIVRVTLRDRYGKRIAARDLAPKDYLQSLPAGGFLAAGQRVDAQVAVVDPGPEASSFELDVCLPAPSGSLRCASDQPATAATR